MADRHIVVQRFYDQRNEFAHIRNDKIWFFIGGRRKIGQVRGNDSVNIAFIIVLIKHAKAVGK